MDSLNKSIIQFNNFLNAEECTSVIKLAHNTEFKAARKQLVGRHNQESYLHSSSLSKKIAWQLQDNISIYYDSIEVMLVPDFFECYLYREGDYIVSHSDSSREIAISIHSTHTLLVYLNNTMIGGETVFQSGNIQVIPEIGKAILFKHGIVHEASKVVKGVKYVLRTSVALRFL